MIFEWVGVPGMIQQIMQDAPQGARFAVAGVFERLGDPDEHAKVLVEPWR